MSDVLAPDLKYWNNGFETISVFKLGYRSERNPNNNCLEREK